MPAKSRSQQRLMGAALGGANYPAAKAIRKSMDSTQIADFARGPMKGKPEHVKKAAGHPHANLGKFLHPKKSR